MDKGGCMREHEEEELPEDIKEYICKYLYDDKKMYELFIREKWIKGEAKS